MIGLLMSGSYHYLYYSLMHLYSMCILLVMFCIPVFTWLLMCLHCPVSIAGLLGFKVLCMKLCPSFPLTVLTGLAGTCLGMLWVEWL
ncbi:hypothetical protein ACSBR2_014159 [Camellia fascicularis]